MASCGFWPRIVSPWKGPIARGTVVSIIIRFGALALGFVQAVLVARLLGPQGYGAIAFAIALVTVASTISMLGLGGLSVREVAHLAARADLSGLRGFLRVSVTCVLGASALAAVGLVLLAQFTEVIAADFRTAVTSAAPLVLPMALLGLFRGIFRGFGRIVAAQVPAELLRPAIVLALLVAVVLTGLPLDPPTYLGLVTAAALLAAIVGAIVLMRSVGAQVRAVPARSELGAWARAAPPFLGISAMAMLYAEINTLMLGWLAGPEEAGLFQPLARLSALMLIGLQAAGMPYGPRVSEHWSRGDIERLKQITRLMTVATTLAAVATCAAILATAPWILGAFGPEFAVNVPALWWIAAAQIFATACGPSGMLLTMTNYSPKAFACLAAALATNAGLALWLIPENGAHGAAQAMAAGIVVWNVTMVLSVRRSLRFDPSLFGALRSRRPSGTAG